LTGEKPSRGQIGDHTKQKFTC